MTPFFARYLDPAFSFYRKGSSGTNTTTTQTNPTALAAYNTAVGTGENVASQPYPTYNSSLVAGFTPTQQAAFGNINNAAGLAQPYIGQAANLVQASTSGINPASTVNQYLSPYTQNVLNSQESLQNQQDAEQQSQLAGSAASAGAFGGDRSAIAAAELGGQQALANNATNSQTLQAGYSQALQTGLSAQEANAWLASQGAFALGNLGQEAQSTALTGAGAQLQAGNQQQAQAQNQLSVPYSQFQAAQAYPYTISNFELGLATGAGGAGGSTSTPGPSTASQVAGLGLTGAALYNAYNKAGSGAGYGYSGTGGLAKSSTVGDIVDSGWQDVPVARGGAIGKAGGGGLGANLDMTGGLPFGIPPNGVGAGVPGGGPLGGGGGGGGGYSGGGLGSLASLVPLAISIFSRGGSLRSHNDGGYGLGHRRGYDYGGALPLGPQITPAGGLSPMMQAGLGSGNPMQGNAANQFNALPTEKLQELAARVPPGSQQGAMLQSVLRRRQMNPQSDPAMQSASPSVMQGLGGLPGMASGGDPEDAYEQEAAQIDADTPAPPDAAPIGLSAPAQSAPDVIRTPPPTPSDTPAPQETVPTGLAATPTTPRADRNNNPLNIKFAGRPGAASDGTNAASTASQPVGLGSAPSFIDRLTSGSNGALLAAGLGMLAGRSPHPGENIGQGGLQGLTFAEQDRQRQAQVALKSAQEQWNRQHQQAMEENAANRTDIYGQRVSSMAALDTAKAAHLAAAAAVQHASNGRFSYQGTDPDTGLPVLLEGATGKLVLGDKPIGLKPQDAARLANQNASLDLRKQMLTLATTREERERIGQMTDEQLKVLAQSRNPITGVASATPAQASQTVSALRGNAAAPAAPAAQSDLPTFNTPEEVKAANLPSGTKFRASDGNTYVVP